jgi:hypothetical protein
VEEIMHLFSRKRTRNSGLIAFFNALILLSVASVQAQQQTLPMLDQKLDPLRARFNQDVAKVRLIVLVDPTCPPCRWGASEIEKQVLETIPGKQLAVYVVWLPVLNFQDEATLQRNGMKESTRVSDARAIHYVDPNGFSGKQYSSILNIPYHGPAWDVYLAFAAGVRWEDRPPVPTKWMHQGGDGMDRSRRLDGRKFAGEIQSLLAEGTKTAVSR